MGFIQLSVGISLVQLTDSARKHQITLSGLNKRRNWETRNVYPQGNGHSFLTSPFISSANTSFSHLIQEKNE